MANNASDRTVTRCAAHCRSRRAFGDEEIISMNTTTAKAVLFDMRFRLDMIRKGMIHPSEDVTAATKALVDELSLLPPDERITISTHDGAYAQWVQESTGRVLAAIQEKDDAEPDAARYGSPTRRP